MAELFLPFRCSPPKPIEHVRSTLILTGHQELRAKGFFSEYSDALSPEMREALFGLAAGTWAPIELAVAHYRAVDGLGIEASTIETIGADVAARTGKHILSPFFALAKRVGPKPWESFARAHDAIDMNWKGGDVRIYKEAPNQALYEWVGQPCASIPYFVTSFGSFMRAVLGLFAAEATHEIVPEKSSRMSIVVRFSWRLGTTRPALAASAPPPG